MEEAETNPKQQRVDLAADIVQLESHLKKKEAEIETLRAKLYLFEDKLMEIEQEKDSQLAVHKAETKEKDERIDRLRACIYDLEQSLADAQKFKESVEDSHENIMSVRMQMDSMSDELEKLKYRNNKLVNANHQLKCKLRKCEQLKWTKNELMQQRRTIDQQQRQLVKILTFQQNMKQSFWVGKHQTQSNFLEYPDHTSNSDVFSTIEDAIVSICSIVVGIFLSMYVVGIILKAFHTV